MKPVNGYVTLEKYNEEEKGLYVPDDSIVGKYMVIFSDSELFGSGDIVAVRTRDLLPFFGQFTTKADNIIAEVNNA